jgi:hypothetical protein
LAFLLSYVPTLLVTDARDYLYGLYSLTSAAERQWISIDYSKPRAQVMRDFWARYITSDGQDFISAICSNVIPALTRETSEPSWVPHYPPADPLTMHGYWFLQGDEPMPWRYPRVADGSLDGNILYLKGWEFDVIDERLAVKNVQGHWGRESYEIP